MARTAHLTQSLGGARASNISYLGAARCRRKFELYYPEGFSDEAYLIAERSHKERAHLEWDAELNPHTFRKLLARGEYRHIADAALRIESRTNLLFSFEKMALRDALRPAAGARLFAHELHAFLYGRGSSQRRFEDWVQAVAELPRTRGRVLTWPVVTAFGFIARPDRHLFLKPRVTCKASRAYGFDLPYQSTPSWRVYERLLTFGAIIRRDLDRRPGLRARDMIDVQSFMWVQGAMEYE
ncbi:hypothetical protein [Ramlibacter rhizophilus]|uniref:Uncharacterized protein n=1 Tax=Ramlibacter rhizophilus TaxID=1781167 RepID=A0A4Z0BFI5_9BURK|nr:hypothetical protein [Ramlibacter rhizophilus]TFY98072.1 hypothetical protein EZ242_16630 [Ramlibacter rhizophilus]